MKMKKLSLGVLLSASAAVPMLFTAQDASAIPAFARKYQTSCYTCHAGFPTRNAFGEAFKNNGYRWPGGEDEEKAKQEQTKMGAEGWKNTFPQSPWPTDIPGFAPLAVWVTGPLLNYADEVKRANGVVVTPQHLNWAGPFDARILYGGTIGQNIGFFGAVQGIATGTTTSSYRATWAFAPGLQLGVGNGFSYWSSGSAIGTYTSVFPTTTGTGLELNYAAGKTGGLNIIAGVVGNGTTTAALNSETAPTHLDDIRYVRVKYKIGGAGLLSGAGGVYGNEYVGLDNHLAIGAGIVNAKKGVMTGNFANETTTYGADLSGNYGNFTGGAAYGRDKDLKLNSYAVDAGYYIYPWLLPKVAYRNIGVANSFNNPTVTGSLTAWLRANLSLAASYLYNPKHIAPATAATTGQNNKNTFTLTASMAF